MGWTAIVPIKPPGTRKTRLGTIGPDALLALTERMLAHVLAVLSKHPDIARVMVLSQTAPPRAQWVEDCGRGLNAELQAARTALNCNLLVLHADLPQVSDADISSLLAIAEGSGAAIAVDRHGTGTNAVAIRLGVPFTFRFGPGSCELHAAQLGGQSDIVHRPGLSHDIDTPEDLQTFGGGPARPID